MSWSLVALIILITYFLVKYKLFSKTTTPLPPGPPADPFIGHIRSIPPSGQDLYFYKLGLEYGDVVYLKVLNQTLVILNSVQAATDLLDKRGANYSDRPYFPIFELFGVTDTLPFLKYGNEFRRHRAMIQQYFSKEKSKEYRPLQIREARYLANNLLSTKDEKLDLFLYFSTAVIIEINYGHQIRSKEDTYLKIASECSQLSAQTGPPGGTPIDLFPFLRHFPSWFPGTYYATYARNSASTVRRLFTYPYEDIKEKMAKGVVKPSYLASLLEDMYREGDEDETKIKRIQAASAITYIAGAETTSATLSFFLLAMVLYPEIQIKAQEEIDQVVGLGRLPEFQDRDSLPYTECVFQETLRWYQAVPAGIPHKSLEDDIYNGMLIPKGSIIIANARAMTLDAAVYKDPFEFDPTRFLPSPQGRGEPHSTGAFGFGRRICPGRYLGEDNVWIAIATILATITISRAVGEDGKEIIPGRSVETIGIANHPSSFPCKLKPRNDATYQLLQRVIVESS